MPDFIMEEFKKHEELILKKTHRSKEDFDQIISCIEEMITIIPEEEISPFVKKAKELCPDPCDVMYFALAMKLKCAILTNDKKLKEQKEITVYNTQEVKDLV